MKTADFDYELPPAAIARHPVPARDASRLLVLGPGGALTDRVFRDLPGLLPAGALLVVNNARVRRARLRLPPTAGMGELLLLRPLGLNRWRAIGKPGRKLTPGRRFAWDGLAVTVETVDPGGELTLAVVGEVEAFLERHGELPLPPYLERNEEPADRERYQTVYAAAPGAVAAPTAGLHFTPELLDVVRTGGHNVAALTLEVGAGTFRPIRGETVEEHRMEAERFIIPPECAAAVNAARRDQRPVIAVGTTVVRALESAAADDGTVAPETRETELFITPGYRFKVVDGLVTNFHLPRSSLLVLVAALAGRERIMGAYRHALENGYRFYSYGDAMFIPPAAR